MVFCIDSPGFGGSEINAIKLVDALSLHYSVSFIINKNADERLINFLKQKGFKYKIAQFSNNLTFILNALLQFIYFIRGNAIFVVWCHHLDSSRWMQFFLALFKKRFIIMEQLVPTDYDILRRSKLTRPIKRFVLSRASAVIICAESQKRAYVDQFNPKNLIVIPNTRDIAGIKSKIPARTRKDDRTQLLFIGRFTEQKNPLGLIKALSLLDNSFFLLMIGEGELLTECKRQVELLGISDRVRFIGYTNNIYNHLANSDIFILNSLYEGLPGVLIEAMAAKVACIATDIPGNNELVINKKTGLIIEPNNPYQLVKALDTLINNPNYRNQLAENAFEHVKNNYSSEIEIKLWLKLIETINAN